MVLYLLKLRPDLVDLLTILLTLYVVPSLLQPSLHLRRLLLDLLPRLLDA